MEPLQDRILIVDDDPLNVRVLVEFLRGEYSLSIARDGPQTLERLQVGPLPDLVLLDVMMPGMDGYEVCRRIKADPATWGVPVVFVTALNQPFDESAAFDAGAVDFLTKPIAPAVLQARVRTHLRLRRSERMLAQQNAQLDEQVRERTRELSLTQAVTIRALASLIGMHEREGNTHLQRGQALLRILTVAARQEPAFATVISDAYLEAVCRLAPLRDLGKIGLPASVLRRAPPLDAAEVREYRRHPTLGRDALLSALDAEGAGEVEFLRIGAALIGSHHECWDGSGYPEGLAGERIPLAGRLMALADAYDAAISVRPFDVDAHHAEAVAVIRAGAGTRFDPRLVEVFERVAEALRAAAHQHPDLPA